MSGLRRLDDLEFLRHGWPLVEMPELLSKLVTDSAPRRFAICALELAGDRLTDAAIVGWGLEFRYVDEDLEDEQTEVLVDLIAGGMARLSTADSVRRLFPEPENVRLVWC
ncbi:hypothetical protein GCM10009765_45880 [Fodinicola feengrottensis]|uniref:Uncharacterized protein n=1 Tax=Fodinicola feengrottensis TaxID=435914 RepID=A0ABN2HPD7_9ACTN